MTTRPVYTVLHKPIGVSQFPFVERRLLVFAFLGAVLVAAVTHWASLALATFALGYAFAWWTRDDPTLLTALLRAARTRTHYDHATYKPVQIEVR